MDFHFRVRHRICNCFKRGSSHDERQISQRCEVNLSVISLLVRSQEASMGKLTPEEAVREHNRGRKAVGEGHSRYWSEPWAYPFESDEHYEERRQAFERGYDHQFQQHSQN